MHPTSPIQSLLPPRPPSLFPHGLQHVLGRNPIPQISYLERCSMLRGRDHDYIMQTAFDSHWLVLDSLRHFALIQKLYCMLTRQPMVSSHLSVFSLDIGCSLFGVSNRVPEPRFVSKKLEASVPTPVLTAAPQ